MKKIFTTLVAGLIISAQVMAVSVKDVCGQFDGDLNIGGNPYPNRSIYLLPGVVDNTVTFVLPDFTFGSGKLGNIVLPNIPMDGNGQLTLENATLYLDSISERATITVVNGMEDEGTVYNSIITADDAMVLLSIAAPSLPEPIYVLFVGTAARTNNYALPNSSFEAEWANNEPAGWHSFGTATGDFKDFVLGNTDQFVPSNVVRPGSKGTHSALLSSKMVLGIPANGNCTNGQINAGSTTADAPALNYNFSNPDNTGFNTPFQGHPDSLVFWAKYQPADLNPANEKNQARVHVAITTNARYQDPESIDYSGVKIADAAINYSAANDLGWQRLSVPFEYAAANADKQPAYILATFTSNMTPGGGSSYKGGSTLNPTYVLDSIYLDDIELVYNKQLTTFTRDNAALSFEKKIASVDGAYCDDCAKYGAQANGLSAQTFIAYDAAHKCIFVYVIADDYAQSGAYNLYRVDFTDSETEGLGPDEEDETGFENIFPGQSRFEKVLINGQLYLRSDNVWFNASGIRVR